MVKALIKMYELENHKNNTEKTFSAERFGHIVGDGQVHAPIRGLAHTLLNPPRNPGIVPLPPSRLFRYRIEWRARGLEQWIDPTLSVCHASDIPIWWASGFQADFTAEDRERALAFLQPFDSFLYGRDVDWGGVGTEDEVRLLNPGGIVQEGSKDTDWERGLSVWKVMIEAALTQEE